MEHSIPQCYYHQNIIKLIDYYISEANTSYSSLEEIDQDTLTAECIKVLGNDAYVCLIETDNLENTLGDFISFLFNGSMSSAHDLAETMRKNANEYFSPILDRLFAERHSDNIYEKNAKQGRKLIIDRINGESRWL
jgi:hypothetical protein